MQRLKQAAPTAAAPEWALVNAQMTWLLALSLNLAGLARESRRWWITARRAAEETGDPRRIALVTGYEAMQMLYEQRPMSTIVERAENALALARRTPCAGVAEALAVCAQARVLQGDSAGARAALDEQADVFERLPEATKSDKLSVVGWPETRLLHTRSFVATHAGHADAPQAQREALQAYPTGHIRPIAQIRLHEALSAVRRGDIAEGIDRARNVIAALAEHDRSPFIRRTATSVLEAVPETEVTRPAVVEYRELLTVPMPPKQGV
ncbi:hypothetical protein [Thermocatellispora tengchongensis]|uniref:hypothetical protein n=1 Tax=Thermocatellispora tengchongensis TaxID=1073253 RepID=UPI003634A0B8